MAREFRKRIYELTRRLPRDEKYDLVRQMRRAAVSLTNNIAEGYGRFHFQENIQFCRQSRGSLYELLDDLNVCMDESYIGDDEHNALRESAYNVMRVLNGYIRGTRRHQQQHET